MGKVGVESIRYYDQYRQNNNTVVDGKTVGPPIPKGVGGWVDLDYAYNVTNGFCEVMGEACSFYYVAGDVWETDVKDSARGGDDFTYADSVDLWFYMGHSYIDMPDGSGAQIVFNSKMNEWSSASRDWRLGDAWNCEWIALYTCESLIFRQTAWNNYSNIFNGLHIMLGSYLHMQLGSEQANAGKAFAQNLLDGDPVQAAWFDATGVDNGPAALSAERESTWHDGQPDYNATTMNNDHYWGKGIVMPDISANDMAWMLYRWRHK
jgi:Family of unknown function (DUF6345)